MALRVPDDSDASPVALVEHFFRYESANLIAVLTRAFGMTRIELVEDMVQQAMLEAMQSWKHGGVPDNPAAWMHRAAKSRILDALRRERVHERAMAFAGQTLDATATLVDRWLEADQLPDSLLRMIFVCCHPSLDRPTQIALTLKILCGFGVAEIARGLLSSRESIKKRIQRGRVRLAEIDPRLDLPIGSDLEERLDAVHGVLYLLFNEGYSTSKGHEPIRDDLCEEAARLCHLLCEHELGTPSTRALLSLMLFHAARLPARIDSTGSTVLLEDQDRSRWDAGMIAVAEAWLFRASPEKTHPEQLTRYHLEAAIARQHCRAASVAATDWASIVRLYDRLLERVDSPIYRLNRAIARSQTGETDQALAELEETARRGELEDYFLLDCARARVHELAGQKERALACCLTALERALAPHERTTLEQRIARLRRSLAR